VEERPDTIERLLEALHRAEGFAAGRPGEAREIVGESIEQEVDFMEYVWGRLAFTLSLSQEMLLSMEQEARWAVRNGYVAEATVPNLPHMFYTKGLEAVDPEAVTIIR
jgi:NitT/TauT family transport system substrate-binding protein